MTKQNISRRHFFVGSLLAGAVPAGGFASAASLKRLGYKSPNEKLNIAAIGSGGNYALAAARALIDTDADAEAIARKAMQIAADICVYTNHNVVVEAINAA